MEFRHILPIDLNREELFVADNFAELLFYLLFFITPMDVRSCIKYDEKETNS